MDTIIIRTEAGKLAGWRCGGGGDWTRNGQSVTMQDIAEAVARGELLEERGNWVACGGIMRTWVPLAD